MRREGLENKRWMDLPVALLVGSLLAGGGTAGGLVGCDGGEGLMGARQSAAPPEAGGLVVQRGLGAGAPGAVDALADPELTALMADYDAVVAANARYEGDLFDLQAWGGCSAGSGTPESATPGVCEPAEEPRWTIRYDDTTWEPPTAAAAAPGEAHLQLLAPPAPHEATLLAASTQEVRAQATEICQASGDAGVAEFLLYLERVPFDFTRFRAPAGTSAADLSARVKALRHERTLQLRTAQDPIVHELAALGGSVLHRPLYANILEVQLPACRVDDLLSLPAVRGAERLAQPVGSAAANGLDRRYAFGLPATANPDGATYDGMWGSTRSGGHRVRFGVIEINNSINRDHSSFYDGASQGFNRIIDTDRCRWYFWGRFCLYDAVTTNSTHGTTVSSVLLSDLTDDQNPSVPGSSWEAAIRSGMAPEATLHYYNASHTEDVANALDEATSLDGIDVVNMSIYPYSNPHCYNGSHGGVREAVEAATGAGVLVVTIAGNDGLESGCTVNSYGTFPDSLTVGGTEFAGYLNHDSVHIDPRSGHGYISTTLAGGATANALPVDLTANFTVDKVAGSGAYGVAPTPWAGTSVAAPAVAGAVGLLKHWVHDRGGLNGLESDPYILRVLLSVMGDGAGQWGSTVLGWTTMTDPAFGFGNLRFVDLDAELGLGTWGVRRFYVQTGTTVQWDVGGPGPERSDAQGWKLAVLFDWNSYADSPDVTVELVDNITGQVVRTAVKQAFKQRLRMKAADMDGLFRGRDLSVRVHVNHATHSFNLYAADYLYTNSRLNHDMTYY